MSTTIQEPHVGMFKSDKTFLTELSAGTGVEAIGGGAAVVLAILGLAGIEPFYMLAISTLAVGACLLIEGAVLTAKHAELMADLGGTQAKKWETGRGITTEFLGGAAGIVLGILALVHVFPLTLISVAALVYGAAMLMGAGTTARLKEFTIEPATEHPALREMAHEATIASSGAQALVALAAVVLGILALVQIAPQTLTLVAMLVLGGSILLGGSAMTTQILSGFGRHGFSRG